MLRENLEVLIVEDRQVMLKIIRRLLVQLGYARIDGATNGIEALALLREKRYDLILSDWNMEPMSGFELLKHVRAEPKRAKRRSFSSPPKRSRRTSWRPRARARAATS